VADPWQVIEGNGQTWIILRSKLRLDNEDITELGQISLASSSFELAASEKDRLLYRGLLKLQASYSGASSTIQEIACSQAVYDEHEAREQLGKLGDYPLGRKLPEAGSGSIFLSQLYEELPTVSAAEGQGVWNLELPWQAWLEGGEIEAEPVLVMAHLGQVGLRTLLCEVLLSLTAKVTPPAERSPASGNYFLAGEEILFNLAGLRMTKVIGTAIKRAFFRLRPGKMALGMEFLTKVDLVFVGSDEGGERLLTAGAIFPEGLKLPLQGLSAQPLYVEDVHSEKIVLANAGEQKAVMKEHFIVTLGDGTAAKKAEILPQAAAAEITQPEAGLAAVESEKPFQVRPRPGEKWLKKASENSKANYSQKKVVSIKFGH